MPPEYVLELLRTRVYADLVNRRTRTLPFYDPKKNELQKKSDFTGLLSWLQTVKDTNIAPFVFA